jgi:hypothetical protein
VLREVRVIGGIEGTVFEGELREDGTVQKP